MADKSKKAAPKKQTASEPVSGQIIGDVKERTLRKRKAPAELPEPSVNPPKRKKKSTPPKVEKVSEQLSEQNKKKPSLQDSIRKINDSSEDLSKPFLTTAKAELNVKAVGDPWSL